MGVTVGVSVAVSVAVSVGVSVGVSVEAWKGRALVWREVEGKKALPKYRWKVHETRWCCPPSWRWRGRA